MGSDPESGRLVKLPKPKRERMKETCSWRVDSQTSVEVCNVRAVTKFECRTCEAVGKEIFTLHSCAYHAPELQMQIRRHALVKHPVNIVRVAAAVLKGETEF